ncbi:HAD family hydrolase [Demequina aurantiaca]|uniref:HAD family hydrolase n=1 Tax=Demequina aurantiaca TaxID=676200 RepID=UPI0007807C8F|nr:HAD family hydrolase [Demequina aurantiaca]
MTHTIVFDFDGTLALGLGPLKAYARCVSELVEASRRDSVEAALDAAIVEFSRSTERYRDAYDAVRQASLALGIDDELLSRGYMASRELLATEAAPVISPTGLRGFLESLPSHVTVTMVTNAPDIRITEALRALDVGDLIGARVCSARKPAGIEAVVRDALRLGPVLSVGDIYEFDLAPALELGADAALVGDTSGRYTDRVTMAGATLADLYPAISSWATSTTALTHVPTGTRTNNERHN